MNVGYDTPRTIKYVIDKIDNGVYLLPAIQRKFVWSNLQVEALFDSILQEYPINTFMLWHVTDRRIKSTHKFYRFLTKFKTVFEEDNPGINTKGYRDFYAVIDGQQRLTALYIGLKGTYAYKLPHKQLRDSESSMPTRFLYLNLSEPPTRKDDGSTTYDFRFLTESEANQEMEQNIMLFKVHDILNFNKSTDAFTFLKKAGWSRNLNAVNVLTKLYKAIFETELISSYIEERQSITNVLDIFIRTNSGGTFLSFSDLLLSYLTVNWQADAKNEFAGLSKSILHLDSTAAFRIDKDFILKTSLVLFSDNIKFRIENFTGDIVSSFEKEWSRVKACITSTFELLAHLGFTNDNLTAKNAVIPIVYWIYQSGIEKDINNPIRRKKDKIAIKKWLCVSLLKGIFSSGTDGVLTKIRNVLKDNSDTSIFPYDKIKDAFKDNPTKNFVFDDDFIHSLLGTQFNAKNCFLLLALIYKDFDFSNHKVAKDHMHPKAYFDNLTASPTKNPDDYKFYKDPLNWNSILNLQLLPSSENESKGDTPLKDWVKREKIDKKKYLIPEGTGALDVTNFKQFLSERAEILTKELKRLT